MPGRVHDLTPAHLDELPGPCRACVFWEVAGAPRGPVVPPSQGREGKEAWWQAAQLEWGTPGKGVWFEDRLVGYATFAPGAHFGRARQLGRAVSEDALLLATLWVHPDARGQRVAKTLLQSVLRETHRRGGRALEAYGARVDQAAPCVLPETFLLANGFSVLHDHRAFPLLRLDLRQTVRWQESLGHALEGVLSALGRRERARVPAPRPAGAIRA
ncbi:MAG TPA: GNAT family N-acetyltransferase [Egibacteraceae bacterium]|nr:GNAT family N-acetyltransferase [Egibacteraceae bacterium]